MTDDEGVTSITTQREADEQDVLEPPTDTTAEDVDVTLSHCHRLFENFLVLFLRLLSCPL